MTSAFRRLHKKDSLKILQHLGHFFPYRRFHLFFFPQHEYEGLFFVTLCAQNMARFFYATLAILFLIDTPLFYHETQTLGLTYPLYDFTLFWLILSFIGFTLASFIVGDYLPRLFGTRLPEKALRFCTPFSSIFMFLCFPLTYLFLRLSYSLSRTSHFDHLQESQTPAKQEIIDLIQKSHLGTDLTLHDKKLIESVLNFRELLAREVMVPRVDVFSLSADMTIKEAAKILENEGYSRTPVYRTTIDNMIGVLMYKDLLSKYQEYEAQNNKIELLNVPIETLIKSVLYTPETKKISNLLQEFRKKQVHLAIVVDEYGGTEGIVTIEDILEAIVGEIADEYDQEAPLYLPQADGSWIVDPRLSILDAEEQLGLVIPADRDYDTIGGYIFHCAGSIPTKGFVIHHDAFEIEILSSNERFVEKVKICPIRTTGPY